MVPFTSDRVRIQTPGSRTNSRVATRVTGTPTASGARTKPTRPMSWWSGSQLTPWSRAGSAASASRMMARLLAVTDPAVATTALGRPVLPLLNWR